MSNGSSLLSAGGSPQSVRPVGVRRLNHIPLYVVGGILALVGLLIAWVASEKGREQPTKPEDHGGSATEYATQVVGDKVGYVRAENTLPSATPSPPPLVTPQSTTPPPNNAEMDARHKPFSRRYLPSPQSVILPWNK
jgi:type IV secretion system protein TrbI